MKIFSSEGKRILVKILRILLGMLRILVGMLITNGFLFLLGGEEGLFYVVGLSIFCTLGVALVGWIPLWWIVGRVTLEIIMSLLRLLLPSLRVGEKEVGTSTRPKATEEVTPPPQPSRDILAIAKYLAQVAAGRMEMNEAVEALGAEGWSGEQIREAREYLKRI